MSKGRHRAAGPARWFPRRPIGAAVAALLLGFAGAQDAYETAQLRDRGVSAEARVVDLRADRRCGDRIVVTYEDADGRVWRASTVEYEGELRPGDRLRIVYDRSNPRLIRGATYLGGGALEDYGGAVFYAALSAAALGWVVLRLAVQRRRDRQARMGAGSAA